MTLNRFIPGEYLFQSWPTEKNITSSLKREIFELRNTFERTSPVLTIQKQIKMYLTRKLYKLKRRLMKILYWAFNRQLKRIYYNKMIAYHKQKKRVTTRMELKICGAVRRIQNFWRHWYRAKLIRFKYSILLQSLYRMHYAQNYLLQVQDIYTNSLDLVLLKSHAVELGLSSYESLSGYRVLFQGNNFVNRRSPLLTNITMTMKYIGFIPQRKTQLKEVCRLVNSKITPIIRNKSMFNSKQGYNVKVQRSQELVKAKFGSKE